MTNQHVSRAGWALVSVALALVTPGAGAQTTLPFTLELSQLRPHGAPKLQGFAFAQHDGKWLCIGGRTTGLHGNQKAGDPLPFDNFMMLNDHAWVIDPGNQVWSMSLADLTGSETVAESLAVTNAPAVQVGDKLYLVGGYGALSDGALQDNATFDRLTIVDVEATIMAIMSGQPNVDAIRQSPPYHYLQVTGGELGHLNDEFYLVFGQNFTGNYTEQANGQYTYQVRKFAVEDDFTTDVVALETYGSEQATPTWRRRDYNLAPARDLNGNLILTAYGGVFTPNAGVWRPPVYIDPTQSPVVQEDSGFEQQMSQYECAVLPVWRHTTKTMYTVFLGGISDTYYDSASRLFVRDLAAPFINQITCVRRDTLTEMSEEFLLARKPPPPGARSRDASAEPDPLPLELQALLGASGHFIPRHDPNLPGLFRDDILDLEMVPLEPAVTVIGYLYGGILATRPNGNFGSSHASDMIFEVKISRADSPVIPVVAPVTGAAAKAPAPE